MSLGMELGIGPGDFVLDGDPAPPSFGPLLLWPNGWMDQDGTWHGARPRPRRLCVRWGPSCPSPKRVAESPKFVLSLLVYSSSSSTASCVLFLEKKLNRTQPVPI